MEYSQQNIEHLFRLIGNLPGQQHAHTPYFEFIKTTHSIWPNQLFNLKASVDAIADVLDQIENDSKTGLIPKLLMLNPAPDKAVLNQIRSRAYKSSVWGAMTHDLSLVEPKSTFKNFEIRLIKETADLGLWLSIVQEALMSGHALNDKVFSSLLHNPNCYFFMGFDEDIPVATSMLFIEDSTAGIYLVSTLESHRKRGYGRETTKQCLLQAKKINCIRADLQATKAGQSVYESLGFDKKGDINVFTVDT